MWNTVIRIRFCQRIVQILAILPAVQSILTVNTYVYTCTCKKNKILLKQFCHWSLGAFQYISLQISLTYYYSQVCLRINSLSTGHILVFLSLKNNSSTLIHVGPGSMVWKHILLKLHKD